MRTSARLAALTASALTAVVVLLNPAGNTAVYIGVSGDEA